MSWPDSEEDSHSWVRMYSPGRLVRLLHQAPHVNISLHRLEDPSFRPDSDLYLQSLGLMGSLPLACLLLTFITLASYLLIRCCRRDTKVRYSLFYVQLKNLMTFLQLVKFRRSRPAWCHISIFALVCCLPLGVGFYGNKELKAGIDRVTQSMVNMDRLVETAQNQVIS